MSQDRQAHFQGLLGEVNRHFHNFLTSITTLVDHTRNLMREDFIKLEHHEEYQNKVKAVFATDPLAQFLQDFRNYMTHYAIPHIGLQKQFGSTETDAEPGQLYIDLDHLEASFNWSAPSRKFIETNKPEIRMLKLVDDYGLKSKNFYDELMLTFQKHLGRELNEVRSMMQESNDLWTKMTGEVDKSIVANQTASNMSWKDVTEILQKFATLLCQRDASGQSVPQKPLWGEPTSDEEHWADHWLREFFDCVGKPSAQVLQSLESLTPRQKYVLLPRIRYGLATAVELAKRNAPPVLPRVQAAWESLVIDEWKKRYRDLWLAETTGN